MKTNTHTLPRKYEIQALTFAFKYFHSKLELRKLVTKAVKLYVDFIFRQQMYIQRRILSSR